MSISARGPNLHDVAARAGVSHVTVSRVINDFPGIRPETREKVLAAIDELGYRRNLAARALVTGRSHTIGLIGPDVADLGPLSTLHAVERAAREAGLHTLLTSTDAAPAQVEDALEFMFGRGIDALVVVAQQQSIRDAVARASAQVPVIHLLTGGEPEGDAAWIDQQAGVRLAFEHLAGLGHRAIQYIAGPADYAEAQHRRAEFERLAAATGSAALPVLEGDWSADSGFTLSAQLDPTATAVMCANDQVALGVIHGLAERGVAVPGDVSVVGFDDTAESRHSLPPLTTVHQDFAAVGERAVELVLARVEGADAVATAAVAGPVEPWLVERDTTAAPRDTRG